MALITMEFPRDRDFGALLPGQCCLQESLFDFCELEDSLGHEISRHYLTGATFEGLGADRYTCIGQ
jgi:hypothetical protein